MANSIGHSFFLTFVHCVLGGSLLDQTLLPHSGSLNWLLLGWIIRCPLHPPWLLINSFSIKNQNPWRGVSYNLPFAFTFAPLQISYMWHDQKCWHGPNYFFSSKWHWSATIIDIKPKENSSVQSRLDSFTFIILVNFFPFTCFMLKEVYLFVSKDFDDDFEQNPPQNFMYQR